MGVPHQRDPLRHVVPFRYQRVTDLARDAVDAGVMDHFGRLGVQWAVGRLTLDKFGERMTAVAREQMVQNAKNRNHR